MRKHWLVPVVLLLLFVFARPWQAQNQQRSLALAPTAEPTAVSTVGPTSAAAPTSAIATVERGSAPDPTVAAFPAPRVAGTSPTPPAVAAATPTAPPTATPLPPPAEPPALEPEVAPPTPAPAPQQVSLPAQPARLIIPQIGLDLEPVPVGLDEQRVPIVPKHDVGWFNRSAMPGQGSNVVLWGHVLRWKDAPRVPAPFARVHELAPGAEIEVIIETGQAHRYRVTEQVQVRPDEVGYIKPTSGERLTLVSCIGDNVIQEGIVTKEYRLITIAEPAE